MRWWGAEQKQPRSGYCDVCKEPMPLYSRVCPYCCYCEEVSSEFYSIMYPHSLLRQMRELVDEAREGVSRDVMREILVTFETLKSVILLAFDDHADVMLAVDTMEDILIDVDASQRRRRAMVLGSVAAVVAIALLSVLFVLIC